MLIPFPVKKLCSFCSRNVCEINPRVHLRGVKKVNVLSRQLIVETLLSRIYFKVKKYTLLRFEWHSKASFLCDNNNIMLFDKPFEKLIVQLFMGFNHC